VKAPPNSGPTTEDKPNTAPTTPCSTGRLFKGTTYVTTVMIPLNIPAEPSPATARPTINALEVGAEPQMIDPISKIPIHIKSTVLIL